MCPLRTRRQDFEAAHVEEAFSNSYRQDGRAEIIPQTSFCNHSIVFVANGSKP